MISAGALPSPPATQTFSLRVLMDRLTGISGLRRGCGGPRGDDHCITGKGTENVWMQSFLADGNSCRQQMFEQVIKNRTLLSDAQISRSLSGARLNSFILPA